METQGGRFRTFFRDVFLDSHEKIELIDITKAVVAAVEDSGVTAGICLVSSMHTTAAVMVNENEEGLVRDIVNKLAEDFPRRGTWLHNLIDDNAHSHLAAAYMGPSVALTVTEGSLSLGQYQSIFFLELDGPRSGRKIVVEVLGEAGGP
jgi:secondary thiamine-phosphate synthase enzyme